MQCSIVCISAKRHEEMPRAKNSPGTLQLHTINITKAGGMFVFSKQERRASILFMFILFAQILCPAIGQGREDI